MFNASISLPFVTAAFTSIRCYCPSVDYVSLTLTFSLGEWSHNIEQLIPAKWSGQHWGTMHNPKVTRIILIFLKHFQGNKKLITIIINILVKLHEVVTWEALAAVGCVCTQWCMLSSCLILSHFQNHCHTYPCSVVCWKSENSNDCFHVVH